MKKQVGALTNIAIFGLFPEYNNQVATLIADQLEMYFLDTQALFEFDISPNTITDFVKINGIKHYRNKQKGAVKYVCTFKNTVMTFESGVLLSQYKMNHIADNCLVIYLHQEFNKIKKYRDSKSFDTPELKRLFCLKDPDILRRSDLAKKYAHITVNASKIGVFKCMSEVLRKIKDYYGFE